MNHPDSVVAFRRVGISQLLLYIHKKFGFLRLQDFESGLCGETSISEMG